MKQSPAPQTAWGSEKARKTGPALKVGRPSAAVQAACRQKSKNRTSWCSPDAVRDGVYLLLWVMGTLLCQEWPVALTLLCATALHECGHLAAFLQLKEPMPALHFGRLGLQLQAARPLSMRAECLTALAGPAVNLLCAALLCLLCGPGLPAALHLLTALGNLAPIDSLDGGRVLRVLCEMRFSPAVAFRIWRTVSFFTLSVGLAAALCALWCTGQGGYLFFLCFSLLLSHISGRGGSV